MKLTSYYFAKFIKTIRGKSIRNSKIDNTAVIFSGCNIYNSKVGRYSYLGYDCNVGNCKIGNFCSIAEGVFIGGGEHPIDWVSTSPVFQNRSHGPRGLSHLGDMYLPEGKETIIGNDVWIGNRVIIKQGVKVGDGAVLGAGAVITKDVPPYAIVGGIPAKVIKYRFDDQTITQLLGSKWWDLPDAELKVLSEHIKTPRIFIEKMLGRKI